MEIDLPKNLSLYKLPEKAEFVLFIIREELKNRKFISALEPVGFDPSFCLHDFSTIILASCGFPYPSEDLLIKYADMLDRHCAFFAPGDDEALKTEALNVYIELQILKRTRSQIADEPPL